MTDNKIIEYSKALKPEIDKLIEKYAPKKANQEWFEFVFGSSDYQYAPEAAQQALLDPIWDFLNRGGKRWRPILFLLIVESVGGDVEKLKDFAIVPELIHNGSLIIDDIEDEGELRRGKPCLHKTFGIDVAVNVGNFMYFLPLIVFKKNKNNFNSDILLGAYNVYAQEMINVHMGQGTDIFWHKGNAEEISENEYFQMCIFKTGCLSRMAAKLAVVLSGKDKELAEKVGRVAEAMGVAFQIQDDVLDITDDVKEGKRSLMVIYTLKKASDKDKKRLIEILNKHTEDVDEIREAISIMEKYNSIKYAKNTAKNIIADAWQDTDKVLKESEAKTRLKDFINYLMARSE
jgi:geranylgeranyl diphosphate synthase type I